MPERVQMSRKHPWRAEHPDAVKVDRSTKWGNPFRITQTVTRAEAVAMFRGLVTEDADAWLNRAVELRRIGLSVMDDYDWPYPIELIPTLAGRDLACWCKLSEPCHADVLLELANGGADA